MQKGTARLKRAGLSAHALKTIAVVAMVIDHLGAAFFPLDNALGFALRIIGRLTAPIMCFFIAEGYYRTSNLRRYAMRLGIFAAISHPAFYYAWRESFPLHLSGGLTIYPTSVMYPLLLGLFALALWHLPNLPPGIKIAGLISLCALSVIGDWGPLAVLWVFVFGVYRQDRRRRAAAFTAITLVYSLVMMTTGFGFPSKK